MTKTEQHQRLMFRAALVAFVAAGFSMAELWWTEATYEPGRGRTLTAVIMQLAVTGVLLSVGGALTVWGLIHVSIADVPHNDREPFT